MRRGFIQIPILVAIIVGTVVVGGSGYFVAKEISKPIATQEISPDTASEVEMTEIATLEQGISNDEATEEANFARDSNASTDENTKATLSNQTKQEREEYNLPTQQREEEYLSIPTQGDPAEDEAIETRVVSQKEAVILSAIDSFLNNPSVTALRNFCQKAKDLQGWTTKQELSPDRQSLIDVTSTLYEDIPWCALVLNEVSGGTVMDHYTWLPYSNDFLFPLDDNSDSDTVRRLKIEYNKRIEEMSKYRIAGFGSDLAGGANAASDRHPITAAKVLLDKVDNQLTSRTGSTYFHLFLSS